MKQSLIKSVVKRAVKIPEGTEKISSRECLDEQYTSAFKTTEERDDYFIEHLARNIVPLIVRFSEITSWTDDSMGVMFYEMTFTFPKIESEGKS